MEKFKLFTDKATGINPFVPVAGLDRLSWPRALLGCFLLIGTLPILLLTEFLVLTFESTHTMLAFVHAHRIISILFAPLQMAFTRLNLILLHHSFWSGGHSVFPQRSKNKDDEPAVKPGTILVCNLQSPLDVVVLQRMFWDTPLFFCFPEAKEDDDDDEEDNKENDKKKKREIGVWWTTFRISAMLRIISAAAIPAKRPKEIDLRAVQMLGRRLGRPVVLFAESAPTNGRAVMQFPETIAIDPECGDVVPVGITYLNAKAANATIPQNPFAWLVRLLGMSALSGGNGIDVSMARPSLVANLEQTGEMIVLRTGGSDDKHADKICNIFGDGLQKIVADTASLERMSGQPCHAVPQSCEDKGKFYDMWVKHGNLV